MHLHRDETTGDAARHGVPPADQTPAGSSAPSAPRRATTHLTALDHLGTGLRAAAPDGAALTWAQITHCTLDAAQQVSTPSSPAGESLKRRMVLNDALYKAFSARQHGRAWQTFDRPTLLLAVADLIDAEHTRPTLDP